MPEQKMTYQQRLFKTHNSLQSDGIDYVFTQTAKQSMELQAEAFKHGLIHFHPSLTNREIELLQLEHGYIEPKTEDDGR